MAKIPRDTSLVRQGRSLRAWLRDLLADDAPTRLAAGEALQASMYGISSIHTSIFDIEWGSSKAIAERTERFKAAIRSAVSSPEFVAEGFVRRLILYRMALKDDWCRRVDQSQAQSDESNSYLDRLIERFQAADGDAERAEAARRCMRWFCASMARSLGGKNAFAGAESIAPPGIMAGIIFKALDVALLADRPGLYAMLADEQLRCDAIDALARIGPQAVDFAGLFFEELDEAPPSTRDRHVARALGSIGRDDPAVIDGLLRRLRSGTVQVRAGAATALLHAGPPLAGRLDAAIDLLIAATHATEVVHAAVPALASVGRDYEAALRRVLEVSEPRPPRWQSDENFPDYRYDAVMCERGVALDSLRYFKQFAERVVPALVGAIDTFEEYDPDWENHGGHARVCAALEEFGPAAAPAVPKLVCFLDAWRTKPDDDSDRPRGVFDLLSAIGPPAVPALRALEEIRAAQACAIEASDADLDDNNPLDRAIIAIRGEMAGA